MAIVLIILIPYNYLYFILTIILYCVKVYCNGLKYVQKAIIREKRGRDERNSRL